MSIETTINLQKKAAQKLSEASEKTGDSKSKLIVRLMERTMADEETLIQSFTRIRYQERAPEEKWTRPHIRLRGNEYEYALDLRKFFKMSFSAIIALAIEKYLDEIIMDLLYPETADEGDNYRAKSYIMIQECIDSVISWRILWGVPRNLEDIIPVEDE